MTWLWLLLGLAVLIACAVTLGRGLSIIASVGEPPLPRRRDSLSVRFWLAVLEAIRLLCGFGSRPYLWALNRASIACWRRDRTAAYRQSERRCYVSHLGCARECLGCGRSAFNGADHCDECEPPTEELPW